MRFFSLLHRECGGSRIPQPSGWGWSGPSPFFLRKLKIDQQLLLLKWIVFGTLAIDGATQLWRDVSALELRSFSHGYGQITYHIVLVPKYRYKIFYERQVKKDCELIINDICKENGYRIHAMEIVEDHVHLFLEFHPTISLSKVVQYLKGSSSYRMFKRHPELKKRYWGGSLWSSGKFFRFVGNVTADTISHYINESQGKQKAEHQLRKPKASGQLRLDDFWIPKNRARGPKHTPSFRAGWPRAVWSCLRPSIMCIYIAYPCILTS